MRVTILSVVYDIKSFILHNDIMKPVLFLYIADTTISATFIGQNQVKHGI